MKYGREKGEKSGNFLWWEINGKGFGLPNWGGDQYRHLFFVLESAICGGRGCYQLHRRGKEKRNSYEKKRKIRVLNENGRRTIFPGVGRQGAEKSWRISTQSWGQRKESITFAREGGKKGESGLGRYYWGEKKPVSQTALVLGSKPLRRGKKGEGEVRFSRKLGGRKKSQLVVKGEGEVTDSQKTPGPSRIPTTLEERRREARVS